MNRFQGPKSSIRGPAGRAQSAIAAGLAFTAVLHVAPAVASSQFASGPFTPPEGITTGLGGTYILSDADNDEVYSIPTAGGTVTSGTPMNFRVFGEIALPSGYTQSGQYFAYGTNATSVSGVAALTGTSGLGAPDVVINMTDSFFAGATVAPKNFGTIAKGQVVLTNESAAVVSTIPSTVDVLNYNGASVSAFTSLPVGINAFRVGFAPTTFGAYAGDLFVAMALAGNSMCSTARATPRSSPRFRCRSASLSLVSGNSPGRRTGSPVPMGRTWAETCSSRLLRRMAAEDRPASRRAQRGGRHGRALP